MILKVKTSLASMNHQKKCKLTGSHIGLSLNTGAGERMLGPLRYNTLSRRENLTCANAPEESQLKDVR